MKFLIILVTCIFLFSTVAMAADGSVDVKIKNSYDTSKKVKIYVDGDYSTSYTLKAGKTKILLGIEDVRGNRKHVVEIKWDEGSKHKSDSKTEYVSSGMSELFYFRIGCSHTTCKRNSDCNDNNPSTEDTCVDSDSCTSYCSNQHISPFCTANTKRCNGNNLEQCDSHGSAWQTVETCQYGCNSTALACLTPHADIILGDATTILTENSACPSQGTATSSEDCQQALEIKQSSNWEKISEYGEAALNIAGTVWIISGVDCFAGYLAFTTIVACPATGVTCAVGAAGLALTQISCGVFAGDTLLIRAGASTASSAFRQSKLAELIGIAESEELANGAVIDITSRESSENIARVRYAKNGITREKAIIWDTPTKAAMYETSAISEFVGGKEMLQFSDKFGISIEYSTLSKNYIQKMTKLFKAGIFDRVFDSVKNKLRFTGKISDVVPKIEFTKDSTLGTVPAHFDPNTNTISFALREIELQSIDEAEVALWADYLLRHEVVHALIKYTYRFGLSEAFEEYLSDVFWPKMLTGAEKVEFNNRLRMNLIHYDGVGNYVYSNTYKEWIFDAARISNLADEASSVKGISLVDKNKLIEAKQTSRNVIESKFGNHGLQDLDIITNKFKIWGNTFVNGLTANKNPETIKAEMAALAPLVLPSEWSESTPPACTTKMVCTIPNTCKNLRACRGQQVCKEVCV